MNKSELIDAIAAKANLSKKDAKAALEATLEAVSESLKVGDAVQLIGFGTFRCWQGIKRFSETVIENCH